MKNLEISLITNKIWHKLIQMIHLNMQVIFLEVCQFMRMEKWISEESIVLQYVLISLVYQRITQSSLTAQEIFLLAVKLMKEDSAALILVKHMVVIHSVRLLVSSSYQRQVMNHTKELIMINQLNGQLIDNSVIWVDSMVVLTSQLIAAIAIGQVHALNQLISQHRTKVSK